MQNIINIFGIFLLIVFIASAFTYIVFLVRNLLFPAKWKDPDGNMDSTTKKILENGPSTLGLPFAALGAFVLVWLLNAATPGELSFEGLSLNIKGPASALMYWIFSFLAIVAGIRLVR